MSTGSILLSLRDLLRLTRVWNLIILALAQYFTGVFLAGAGAFDFRLGILILSTVAVAAGGYIINDYYDIKIDYVNKPQRVVVGKTVSRRLAIFLHVSVTLLGIVLGFLVDWTVAAVNLICAVLLWWYSNLLKRLPFAGNVAVALLTGLSIQVVGIALGKGSTLIAVYAGFAFCLTLVREIVKDMEDWRGDTTYGCRTLPIVLGLRKTKWVVLAAVGLFVTFVSGTLIAYSALSASYLVALVLLPSVILVERLWRADTVSDFARLSLICKILLVLGIGSMPLTG